MRFRFSALRVLYFVALTSIAALACEYLTVRDAAFQEPRDIHRLVLLTAAGDSGIEAMETEIQSWLREREGTLNLEFVKVDVDREGIDWSDFGIPGPPPSTPATVLVGTNQRTRERFFVRHWEPAPNKEDLEKVVSSPFRSSLVSPLLESVAVLVHVPGNQEKREEVPEILNRIEKDWDEREKAGISVVTLDRENLQEELVLSFLGIPSTGSDWVGILFGRCKAMDPWMGGDINESELNGQLETLVGECGCLQTAGALGVDLPMIWTEEMDSKRVPLRVPVEEDEATALAGIRESRVIGGPILMLVALLVAVLSISAGLLLARRHRTSSPLATPSGR